MKHKDLIKKLAKKNHPYSWRKMCFKRPSIMEEQERELRKRCNCSGDSLD